MDNPISTDPTQPVADEAPGPRRPGRHGGAGKAGRPLKQKAPAMPGARPRSRPKSVIDPVAETGDAAGVMTKKQLFTRLKARAEGVNGRELRVAMDALLVELGDALVAGETLKLPGLGTLKVQKYKPLSGADVVVCKLRRKKPVARPKEPLAEPEKGR